MRYATTHPSLVGSRADGDRGERAAGDLPRRHLHVAPDGHGQEQPLAQHRVGLEEAPQQPHHHLGALGVPDEHDLAPLVVLPQVVREGVGHVREGHRQPRLEPLLAEDVGADGDLAVERRVDPADLAEPRDLRRRRGGHPREVGEVGVVLGGEGEIDGGVDVETVDLGRRRGDEGDDGAGAVGVDLGGVEIGVAAVAAGVGPAEPQGVVGVARAPVAGVLGRRWWGEHRGRWEGGAGGGEGGGEGEGEGLHGAARQRSCSILAKSCFHSSRSPPGPSTSHTFLAEMSVALSKSAGVALIRSVRRRRRP